MRAERDLSSVDCGDRQERGTYTVPRDLLRNLLRILRFLQLGLRVIEFLGTIESHRRVVDWAGRSDRVRALPKYRPSLIALKTKPFRDPRACFCDCCVI